MPLKFCQQETLSTFLRLAAVYGRHPPHDSCDINRRKVRISSLLSFQNLLEIYGSIEIGILVIFIDP